MSAGIAVLCPFGADGGLISKAVSLTDGAVRVLVPQSQAAAAGEWGATHIHTLPDHLEVPDEAAFARWLANRIRDWGETVVLAPATVSMRSILPMTAWHLQAGLTADCTALSLEDGRLLQTRPAFGNNMMASIRTVSPIQMATVRPHVFHAQPHPVNEPQLVAEHFAVADSPVTLREFTPYTEGEPLGQADIILAGGVGIGSAAGGYLHILTPPLFTL